jgi:subtilisin family serine protease
MSNKRAKHKPAQLVLLILLIVLMILSFTLSFIPIGHAQEPEPEITTTSDGYLCAEGEVLVKFKQAVSDSSAENTLQALSSESDDIASDIVVADVPEGETVESFVDSLEAMPEVEYAQPNYVYTLDRTTVNDPYAGNQWHLDTMGVYDAWDITMGDPNVVVAVIDTGVDLDHPDLTGQIVAQTDVVANDGNAQDDDGHGTHVAGIIAAKANNGIGVAGIAPGAKLMAVDVFGNYLNPETGKYELAALTSKVIQGIQYAVSNGADIINMSLGGSDYDEAFRNAVDAAVNAGVVVVAAAGNEGENGLHYPSDFDSCISVIATDSNDTKASFSNYGPQKDIAAPGVNIYSTFPNDVDPAYPVDYVGMNGTSMASPVVAGVAALMLSANPTLTVGELRNILYSTAVDLSVPGVDALYGYGRINASAAVATSAGISYTPVSVTGVALSETSLTMIPGETYQLTASVSPFSASNKAVTYSSDNITIATVSSSGLVTAKNEGPVNIIVTTDDEGLQSTCQITVKSTAIASDVYTIDKTNAIIKGIGVNTSVSQFKANLKNAPEDIKMYNATGTLYTGSILSTGTVVKLEFKNKTFDSLAVALTGDTSGDGTINISDYTNMRLHILELSKLSGAAAAAADVDKNGVINIGDYTLVRLHILGLKSLY